MKNRKALLLVILLLAALLVFAGCGKKNIAVEDLATEHELEFGGVYLKMTIDDFNAKGFKYGDSVDVVFSNGYELKDIPYYNGYYVAAGEPLLIAYPGYDYIKAAVNYGEDLWETAELREVLKSQLKAGKVEDLWLTAKLEEHSTATVRLNEQGKYKAIQDARDIHYYDEREKYETDVEFANFREMTVGNLKAKTVYRSASPCDNQHNRAPYVDALIKEAGVRTIMNLADSTEKIEKYIAADGFKSPYILSRYNEGRVIPLAMSMNFAADDFKGKIVQGFIAVTEKGGPFLVHCTEGKDRTGFVCMLIEALAGASYQEIVDDYMLTYDNYYKITKEKDKAKYDIILEMNLDAMIKAVVGDDKVDIKAADLSQYAKQYLIAAGMNEKQVESFKALICK